jgi:hypothetical protein
MRGSASDRRAAIVEIGIENGIEIETVREMFGRGFDFDPDFDRSGVGCPVRV